MSVADGRCPDAEASTARGLEASLEHTRSMSEPSAVEEHVRGCEQCRRELSLLSALRSRLRRLPKQAPGDSLSERMFAGLGPETQPPSARPSGRPSRRWLLVSLGGWASAAALGALYVAREGARTPAAGPALPPMVDEALREYGRASASELPKAPGPGELEAALGHAIPYLEGADLKIVSAWLTTIRDEPSAAIAYRFRDRVLIQFVVSEALFFRPPAVRNAVAHTGAYFAQAGGLAILGRAGRGVGSLLVGEMSPAALEGLFPRAG